MANNFICDEQLKSIAETREMKYKLDRNEWIAQGEAKGKAEGETNAKIEAVINLIKETGWPLERAMTVLKVDASYKPKIEAKLKELGIN